MWLAYTQGMTLSRQHRRFVVQLALRGFRRAYGVRCSQQDALATELSTGDVLIKIAGPKPAPPQTLWLVRADTIHAVELDEAQAAELPHGSTGQR